MKVLEFWIKNNYIDYLHLLTKDTESTVDEPRFGTKRPPRLE